MTDHEKKLNKVDLTAYKHQEGQVYATIPIEVDLRKRP
jgi:hypothetical protein